MLNDSTSNSTFYTSTSISNLNISNSNSHHQQQQHQQQLHNYLQTQFELSLELRKFINIDLFQRGYYQIRATCKQQNKQVPFKIETQLSTNKNNENLSDSMFASCLYNDYAVSKTFLILYRNEEIILDDHVLFKITTLVNVLNLLESFQKLDLILNVELWFTENDYKLEKISTMQLLCSRSFKIHFDPRIGIHLQVPILFDYFHLSAVTATLHCMLLTLLPPIICFNGINQNNTTLGAILFGKDISKLNQHEITSTLLKRASAINNSICNLLVIAYENLQEHVKIVRDLLPSDKQFQFNPVDCQVKFKKICNEIGECMDAETIDDLASRFIAQCSAENICLWCTYLDNFILNDHISAHLALDYHSKRLKRFSESFFTRELSKKHLIDPNENFGGENYTQLNDLVKQSLYYAQVPKLLVECTELDGTNDQIPIIFEDNYTSIDLEAGCKLKKVIKLSSSSSSSQSSYKSQNNNSSSTKSSSNQSNSLITCIKPLTKNQCLNNYDTSKSSKNKTTSKSGTSSSGSSTGDLNGSTYTLSGKKNRRRSRGNDSVLPSENSGTSIQLVSYRKTLNDEVKFSDTYNRHNSTSSRSSTSDLAKKQYSSTSSSEFTNEIVNERAVDVEIEENKREIINSPVLTGDYSSKSKVLYESFRGKTNTLDRRRVKNLNNVFDSQTSKTSTPIRVNTLAESIMMKQATLIEDDLKLKNHFDVNRSQSYMDFSSNNHAQQETRSLSMRGSIKIPKTHSLALPIDDEVYKFVIAKENLKHSLSKKYSGNVYSEFSSLFCDSSPYFYGDLSPQIPINLYRSSVVVDSLSTVSEKLHLIVCVHGLDGNSGDLRLVRTYLELALPGARMEFLMSEQNQNSTFDDIDTMTVQLINEINDYIELYALIPDRISFIGHSLGNLIIRSTVAHSMFAQWTPRLYTYLSLSGPHLGTLYNSSGLINMGMWIMQKWKKSGSLLQLSLKDNQDPYKSFLFELSKKPTLQHFKNILLVASPQDRYVPYHSARIDMCKAALRDNLYGGLYKQMFTNIVRPLIDNPNINFIRYTVHHTLPNGTSNLIGRAAHIANLDSELFVEKLILVSAAKYFR